MAVSNARSRPGVPRLSTVSTAKPRAAIVWSQGGLDQVWQTVNQLPLIVRLGAWVLFLPVMAGLWIWETTWPLIVRLVLIAGVAGWNILVFLPKALQAKP